MIWSRKVATTVVAFGAAGLILEAFAAAPVGAHGALENPVSRATACGYTMKGKLPSGKSGRHLIYTVWQNSDTPDTYYSCSDIVFPASTSSSSDTGSGTGDSAAATGNPADPEVRMRGVAQKSSAEDGDGSGFLPLAVGGAVALLVFAGIAILLARRADDRRA